MIGEWFITSPSVTYNTGDVNVFNFFTLKTRARPTVWERLLWPEPWERAFDQTFTLRTP